jgi:response regulator RpfG family c-di-GMP phosphodiesterase
MLECSGRQILQAATLLTGQHHEEWDGSGYLLGLAGEDSHIFGRIGAVADVFDALGSSRCYQGAWPPEEIKGHLRAERGRHFAPAMVDWVLNNIARMVEVRRAFPDPDEV